MSRVSVDKMRLRTEMSCIPLGNKVFVNVLNVNSDPKNKFPTTTVHQLSIIVVRKVLLTGKIWKAY